MGAFSTMTEFLEGLGFFNYLAFFLLFILLDYLFRHLIGKHVESGLERLQKVMSNKKKALIYRIIGLIAAIICFLFLSFLGTLIAAIIVIIIGAIVLFLLYVADTRMLSLILSVLITVALFLLFASFAGEAAAFLTVILLSVAVIFFLVIMAMRLMGFDVLSFFQK
jgi:hypothetical protein